MRLTAPRRTSSRSGTIARSGVAARVADVSLRPVIVVTRTVLATLCAARAAADWLHGHATVEGDVALMLVIAFAMWLTAEAVGEAIRAAGQPKRCHPPTERTRVAHRAPTDPVR